MKKLAVVISISILVACGTQAPDENAEQINEQTKKTKSLQAFEQTTVSVNEAKENSLFSTTLKTKNDTKQIYIERINDKVEMDGYVFANFIFYLVDPGKEKAVVQKNLSIYNESFENLENITFETIDMDESTFIVALHPIANDTNEMMMWTLADNKLKEITFNDQNSFVSKEANDVFLKQIQTDFLQTVVNKNKGWHFITWEFDKENYNFMPYFEKIYEAEDELQIGEYFLEKWLNFNDYFLPFPYITFTKDDEDRLLEGELKNIPYELGTKIDDLIDQETIIEGGYLDGAPYYEIPGAMYFYNEETREIFGISVSGDMFTNANEIEEILGKPQSSGRSDMYPDEVYSFYEWDEYMLMLMYNEQGDLNRIEFQAKQN